MWYRPPFRLAVLEEVSEASPPPVWKMVPAHLAASLVEAVR